MQLADVIAPSRIGCQVQSSSKKRALEELSILIAKDDEELSQIEVFESLISRERLGSTGLGRGIAIPHGRLKASNKTIAAFLQLSQGVDYDAPDHEPVDLLCALLVPPESTDEHLQILAQLSEMFRDPALRQKLREASQPEDLYKLLVSWKPSTD